MERGMTTHAAGMIGINATRVACFTLPLG
jgi:chorismate-pyruvate lyase